MNTTEINGKEYTLTEGEGGKLTLTPLIKQPRTPEAGDVWSFGGAGTAILDSLGGNTQLVSNYSEPGCKGAWGFDDFRDRGTYIGKFSEVYVRRDGHVSISDVIDALSIEDIDGDSVMSFLPSGDCAPLDATARKTYEALAKLGIKSQASSC